MKFLLVDGVLLKNTYLNPTCKFILSFLYNLSKQGKGFWGSFEYLASEFGVGSDYITKQFEYLEKKGLIKKNELGYFLAAPWYQITDFGG